GGCFERMASTEEVVVEGRGFGDGEEGKVVTDKETRHSHSHGSFKKRDLTRMELSRISGTGHAQVRINMNSYSNRNAIGVSEHSWGSVFDHIFSRFSYPYQ
ncbi:hypothetical protein KI387_009069, partial [Taxus chinensis]